MKFDQHFFGQLVRVLSLVLMALVTQLLVEELPLWQSVIAHWPLSVFMVLLADDLAFAPRLREHARLLLSDEDLARRQIAEVAKNTTGGGDE